MKVYEFIAIKLDAINRCEETGNTEWYNRHSEELEKVLKNALPQGSGFDSGCELLDELCNENKLVFSADFHHMTEHGYYDGWSEHKVIATPSFIGGFTLRITGKNRNGIKEYIADVFHEILDKDVDVSSQ